MRAGTATIHKFGDLTGSDKAGFEVKYADGTTLVKFYQDYITASGTANPAAGYSGFQSLGYTGGDGSLVSGNGAVLKDFDSTLELNLNRAGYTGYTVNSPMPSDPQYAGWEAINGYLFTISAAAFASKGFGGVTVFDQHNSPAKTGSSNSLIPVVTEDESVNTAVVSAQLGGGTVVAIADAHVRIGQAATGAKFFVVDTGVDDMFRYSASGAEVGSFTLQSGNTDPRGLAADADGTRLWVLDKDKNVNVYSADGSPAGLWKADGLGKEPEGIALDGSDLWIVDRGAKKIFWFDEAASRTSGTVRATTTFAYSSVLNAPKGIVTDGTRLWLVNDGAPDKVFVYTIARDGTGAPTALTGLTSWTLDSRNAKPTGLTIDPTGGSQSIWVVDDGTNQVFEYANAQLVTSGSLTATHVFQLAAGNSGPQDIADPRVLGSGQLEVGGALSAGLADGSSMTARRGGKSASVLATANSDALAAAALAAAPVVSLGGGSVSPQGSAGEAGSGRLRSSGLTAAAAILADAGDRFESMASELLSVQGRRGRAGEPRPGVQRSGNRPGRGVRGPWRDGRFSAKLRPSLVISRCHRQDLGVAD